jgi:hypothetical protein
MLVLLAFSLMISFRAHSQVGGSGTYEFLNLTTSARAVSLGTKTIAIDDDDLNLAFYNPSLLSEGMEHHLALNYVNYFAGIHYGYAAYSPEMNRQWQFAAGLHYLSYGTFRQADENGVQGGRFSASEYALNLTASMALDTSWRIGVNLKPVYSDLYEYQSLGLSTDLGVTYTDTSGLFTAALVFKNLGSQIIPYHKGAYESLPFEIQLGASLKLRHAPFRLIAVAEHLETPDLTYSRPAEDELLYGYYQGNAGSSGLFDQVMRHMILGVEFIPLEHFYVRAGYHYRRRQEMKVESRLSTVGFSWGFGIKIFKLYLNYGRGTYHLAGGTNHFSVRANLNEFN